jgi:PAS domain S-box-containing protein
VEWPIGQEALQGWLWLLTAIGYLEQPEEDHGSLLASCPFPVAIVDLPARQFVLMSPPLLEMLAQPAATAQSVDPSVMVEDPGDLRSVLALMMAGAIDVWEVRRRLRRPGREPLEAETWMVISDTERRARALWLVAPTADDGIPQPSRLEAPGCPDQALGLVLGSFDDDWRISRISADVQAVLGYRPEELVGRRVIDLVHPEDLPGLFSSMAGAIVSQAGVGTRRRLRQRNGEWIEVRGVITPLAGERRRFGFAFSPAWGKQEESGSSGAARAAVLERHMWQIAIEVAASGVVAGFHRTTAPGDVPGLEELSPRQWEVLTKLLQGERVPSIARQLFISQSTVRNHLTDIFRKVGVRSQDELLSLLRS